MRERELLNSTVLPRKHRPVVTGVGGARRACDEYWLEEATGLSLADLIRDHRPAPGEVSTIAWVETSAA